jgi:RING finger and CHY zinc finger domain-containing protein 1
MSEEFKVWTVDIHCNECDNKSNTKYHFSYHKCQECCGYNTIVDKINKVRLGSKS